MSGLPIKVPAANESYGSQHGDNGNAERESDRHPWQQDIGLLITAMLVGWAGPAFGNVTRAGRARLSW